MKYLLTIVACVGVFIQASAGEWTAGLGNEPVAYGFEKNYAVIAGCAQPIKKAPDTLERNCGSFEKYAVSALKVLNGSHGTKVEVTFPRTWRRSFEVNDIHLFHAREAFDGPSVVEASGGTETTENATEVIGWFDEQLAEGGRADSLAAMGIEFKIPPFWHIERPAADIGGPLSLDNFRGAYREGGHRPPGGAEVSIAAVAFGPAESLEEIVARDIRGTTLEFKKSVVVGGLAGIEVAYSFDLAPSFIERHVAVYARRGELLYKFFLSYTRGDPQEKAFVTTFDNLVRSVKFVAYPPPFTAVSPRRNYRLSNERCGTKSLCAYVTDLKTGGKWLISETARDTYYKEFLGNLPEDAGWLYVSPVALAISPDEEKALLEMEVVANTYLTEELAKQNHGPDYFVPRSYVVSLRTGAILRVLRPEDHVTEWWKD